MKRTVILILVAILLFSFTACDDSGGEETATPCTHEWISATCTTPKTCSLCGDTEGEPSAISHSYVQDICEHCGIIQLTLDNYEDYIECSPTVKVGNYSYDNYYDDYIIKSLKCSFEATGNTHYKYNNVTIHVKFSHYDSLNVILKTMNDTLLASGEPITKEAYACSTKTVTIKLNVGGNGSQTCEISTSWNYDNQSSADEKRACIDTDYVFDRTFYEVTSVYGTVQEYK